MQNKLTDAHQIELMDCHESWDNKLDPEQDDGLSQNLEQKFVQHLGQTLVPEQVDGLSHLVPKLARRLGA